MLTGLLGTAVAQNGTIRGHVTSGTDGQAILGATVRLLLGSQVRGGAYTDLEGNYTIQAPAGKYELIISYISFLSDTIRDVEVAGGAVVFNESILLEELTAREDLAVEITATRSQATEVALFNIKRTSINTLDGITLDQVRRAGDANVAAAMARVVGVTVEGGKYVYVRGLGDRYSLTMLNGAEIPGLDPNRNTVQMDIFPSNLIDNVLVFKNFTPNLPGSFSGGLVDVRTKDFPNQFTLRLAASLGYNTQASFNENFLADALYSGDALALGNDIRDMPAYIADDLNGTLPRLRSFTTTNEVKTKGSILDTASRQFQTPFTTGYRRAGLNQNYEFSIGNQHLIGKRPFGYIASLTYMRNFEYYEDGIRNLYRLRSQGSTILDGVNNFKGDGGEENVLWGGLIKLSYKPADKHKFSVNLMHNQASTSYAEDFSGLLNNESGYRGDFRTTTTGYIERAISAVQAQGDHVFGPLQADWIASYASALQYEPDLRFFAYQFEPQTTGDTTYGINPSNGYEAPLRFYRDLGEDNLDVRLNFTLPFAGIQSTAKSNFRFGGAYTAKDRSFKETRFEIIPGRNSMPFNGDIDAYFDSTNFLRVVLDENGDLVIPQLYQGLYYQDQTLTTNVFDAEQRVYAAYGMVEMLIYNRFKFVGGARYENTEMRILPQDTTLLETLKGNDPDADPGRLVLADVLPAANLIYSISSKMNVRGGYSRTLARPSIIEFSPFQRLPYIGGPVYEGNPNLKRTLIGNYDLRWEWYFSLTEMVSVSFFYKNFTNPIEVAQDSNANTNNIRFTYENRESAYITGLEFEVKKNFAFIHPSLEKLQLSANTSFNRSVAQLTAAEIRAIQAVDSAASDTRPLFGQSPYIVNAELAYIDRDVTGLQMAVNFNVFGPRLFTVGIAGSPDIYEQPRPALNFSISKDIGKYLSVRFRANNLLNPETKFTQDLRGEEYIFSSKTLGRTYSLGVVFSI
ncbi:MAG: TonB-dependent receptor [Bacteroidia bacterium]